MIRRRDSLFVWSKGQIIDLQSANESSTGAMDGIPVLIVMLIILMHTVCASSSVEIRASRPTYFIHGLALAHFQFRYEDHVLSAR